MATLAVGSSHTHTSLQAAHDAAAAGDTLEIHTDLLGPNGVVKITKNNLTWVAPTGKPKIDGQYTDPPGNLVKGPFDFTSEGYCFSRGHSWNAQFQFQPGVSGGNIANLLLTRSTGNGVLVNEASNITMTNVDIDHAGHSAMRTLRANNITITGGTWSDCIDFMPCTRPVSQTSPSYGAKYPNFPGTFSSKGDTNITISGVTVYGAYGSGIIMNAVTGGIVEDCTIYDNWRPGINASGLHNGIFRRNLIYGPTDGNPQFGPPFGGIVIYPEKETRSNHNVLVENNMIARANYGVWFAHEGQDGVQRGVDGEILISENIKIVHNTIYRPVNAGMWLSKSLEISQFEGNIFDLGGKPTHEYGQGGVQTINNTGGNMYFGGTPTAPLSHASDLIGQDPQFANPQPILNGQVTRNKYFIPTSSPAVDASTGPNAPADDIVPLGRVGVADMGAHEADGTVIPPVGDTPCTTAQNGSFDRDVSIGTDDSGVLNGTWNNTGSLRSGDRSAALFDDRSAITFRNIPIAQGDTVVTSVLSLAVRAINGTGGNLIVRGELTPNSTQPTSLADFDSRTLTTASVTWATGTPGLGTIVSPPDLSAIVQEIIDQAGWSAGNAITFFIHDNQGAGFQVEARTAFDSFDEGGTTTGPSFAATYSCTTNSTGTCENPLYANSDFDSVAGWTAQLDGTFSATNGVGNMSGTNAQTPFNQVFRSGLAVTSGVQYRVTMIARTNPGSSSDTLRVQLIQNNTPFSNIGLAEVFSGITSTLETYTAVFTATATEADARLRIRFSSGDFGIDLLCIEEFSGNITAEFTPEETVTNIGTSILFSNGSTSDSGITSHSWNFGDGSTSTLTDPNHTYSAEGVYIVTLTVSGPDGTDSTTGQVIVISDEDTTLPPDNPCVGVAVSGGYTRAVDSASRDSTKLRDGTWRNTGELEAEWEQSGLLSSRSSSMVTFRDNQIPVGAQILTATVRLYQINLENPEVVPWGVYVIPVRDTDAVHPASVAEWNFYSPTTATGSTINLAQNNVGFVEATGLAAAVQEIIDLPTWEAGNLLSFYVEDVGGDIGKATFASFETDPDLAAQLVITYRCETQVIEAGVKLKTEEFVMSSDGFVTQTTSHPEPIRLRLGNIAANPIAQYDFSFNIFTGLGQATETCGCTTLLFNIDTGNWRIVDAAFNTISSGLADPNLQIYGTRHPVNTEFGTVRGQAFWDWSEGQHATNEPGYVAQAWPALFASQRALSASL